MDALKKLTGSVIHAILGPNKSNKFLMQDKDVCISRCPLHILQKHYLQDAASIVIEETLLNHHELYGCSTVSLLAMWYFWDEEFRIALEDGCEILNIIEHSQNILEVAISTLQDIKENVHKILAFEPYYMRTSQNSVLKINSCTGVPLSIQYSSRHFSPLAEIFNSEGEKDFESAEYSKVNEKCFKELIQSLNHDEDLKITEVVLECWKKQRASINCTKFQKDGVIVFPIVLHCCNYAVLDGLLIKSNVNVTQYWKMRNNDESRALIIMGGITYKYVHLGFAPKVSVSAQMHNISLITKEDEWRKKCCDCIVKLNINILLIKENIDPKIVDFCLAHSVLVLVEVPLKIFKLLCTAFQHSPCSYLLDCGEESVIKNWIVKEWRPNDYSDGADQYFLINEKSKITIPLQSIVLCHPSSFVLEMLEHQMHHLMSRLSWTFQSESLLPGEGKVERWCIDYLNKHLHFYKLPDPVTRIMTAITNGFQSYVHTIAKTRDVTSNGSSRIMDEMSSKINAWRSALSLVLLTLQCDTVVINGVEGVEGNKIY